MDSNNAVNSTQLSEQMNTAIPNEVHASISADPARPTDIPELCLRERLQIGKLSIQLWPAKSA